MATGYITIASVTPAASVTAIATDDVPTISAGYGGWSEASRPGRQAATVWEGFAGRRMTISVLLDGLGEESSVESQITAVDTMARSIVDGHTPIVSVTGDTIPVEVAGARWVIDRVDWGNAIRRQDGQRVRQVASFEFLEFVAPQIVIAGANASRGTTTYVIKKGDTLTKIAQRLLGDKDRWREIATLNGIRDPRKLKVGARIKIPAAGR